MTDIFERIPKAIYFPNKGYRYNTDEVSSWISDVRMYCQSIEKKAKKWDEVKPLLDEYLKKVAETFNDDQTSEVNRTPKETVKMGVNE